MQLPLLWVLRAQELVHRFGLTAEVPCSGTDLLGRCKLLGDAREAHFRRVFTHIVNITPPPMGVGPPAVLKRMA